MPKDKGSEGKSKAPNAYDINPMMMDQLGQITPENFGQFMMGNPEIVPDKFRKAYWKNLKTLGLLIGGSSISGIGLNMIVTRTFSKVLIMPRWMSIPLRLFIFAVPFGVLSPKLSSLYNEGNEMIEDQFIKIQRLRRTGNIDEYFS